MFDSLKTREGALGITAYFSHFLSRFFGFVVVAVSGFCIFYHLVFRFFVKNKVGWIPLWVSVQSDVRL